MRFMSHEARIPVFNRSVKRFSSSAGEVESTKSFSLISATSYSLCIRCCRASPFAFMTD